MIPPFLDTSQLELESKKSGPTARVRLMGLHDPNWSEQRQSWSTSFVRLTCRIVSTRDALCEHAGLATCA